MMHRWIERLVPTRVDKPNDRYVARLIRAICLTVLVATIVLSLANSLVGQAFASTSMALAAIASASILLLLRWGQLWAASTLLPTMFLLFLSLNMVDSHGIHDIAMVGFPAIIVLSGLLLGTRAMFAFTAASIVILGVIYALEMRGYVPEAMEGATDLSDVFNISAILLATTVLLRLLVKNLYRGLELSRQARAEQQRLITELEAKNAELERFAYTVSHDLKTPLVTINNFLGYVLPSAESGNLDRLRKDIARISGAANHMGSMLDELLELARIGIVDRTPLEAPFEELVQEALDRAAGALEQRGVKVTLEPDLPFVVGDYGRLIEVMQNLLENAVKFMGEQEDPRIEIGARRDDETVFFVRDNGIGIEPRFHQRVFGLFRRLDQSVEGSGVGLAITKRVIESHGGRIWIESEGIGRGTTVCFTIPGGRS